MFSHLDQYGFSSPAEGKSGPVPVVITHNCKKCGAAFASVTPAPSWGIMCPRCYIEANKASMRPNRMVEVPAPIPLRLAGGNQEARKIFLARNTQGVFRLFRSRERACSWAA